MHFPSFLSFNPHSNFPLIKSAFHISYQSIRFPPFLSINPLSTFLVNELPFQLSSPSVHFPAFLSTSFLSTFPVNRSKFSWDLYTSAFPLNLSDFTLHISIKYVRLYIAYVHLFIYALYFIIYLPPSSWNLYKIFLDLSIFHGCSQSLSIYPSRLSIWWYNLSIFHYLRDLSAFLLDLFAFRVDNVSVHHLIESTPLYWALICQPLLWILPTSIFVAEFAKLIGGSSHLPPYPWNFPPRQDGNVVVLECERWTNGSCCPSNYVGNG